MTAIPTATLASLDPYPVPTGGWLLFQYAFDTTDGWPRGTVCVRFADGRPDAVVARRIPVIGDAHRIRALGDYARLFPEPLPVEPG